MKGANYFIFTIFIIILALVSGCTKQEITPTTTSSPIIISKVYTNGFTLEELGLTIALDGAVVYYEKATDEYGVNFEQNRKEGKINNTHLIQLIQLFDSNFFGLEGYYGCENAPTDAGTNTFNFKDETREKSVGIYGGCELPPELKSIDEELNKIKDRLK